MISYSYEELIDGLNRGKLKFVRFCVNNYPHYKNCTITRIEQKMPKGKSFFLVKVILTQDSHEKISFLNSFEEDTKLFHMGKKGSFTLKQLWPEIIILEIVNN